MPSPLRLRFVSASSTRSLRRPQLCSLGNGAAATALELDRVSRRVATEQMLAWQRAHTLDELQESLGMLPDDVNRMIADRLSNRTSHGSGGDGSGQAGGRTTGWQKQDVVLRSLQQEQLAGHRPHSAAAAAELDYMLAKLQPGEGERHCLSLRSRCHSAKD